jgi:hypothetical protein
VPCSVAVKGAVKGTLDCTSFSGAYVNGTGSVDASVSGTATIGTSAQSVLILVAIAFAGDLHTGTFKNTDANAGGDVIVEGPGNTPATWEATAPSLGSYTLQITDTGTESTGTAGKNYANVHGSLTAYLVPAGNGAAGADTLTATF